MNHMRQIHVLQTAGCAVFIALSPLFAQGPTLAGTGFTDPSIIRVAPGQITTLFVTGLQTVLASSQINADVIPLPTKLAGISVTLNETTPLPLLSIQQMSVCNTAPPVPPPPPSSPPPSSPASPDCLITAITLQIPFDLPLPGENKTRPTELTVSENGAGSKTFTVYPISDNLHVIKTCDVFPSPKVIRVSQPVTMPYGTLCVPLVTHGNGDLITADDPAQVGEEIVIWAFGLGQTNPMPKAGEASPTPAATFSSFLYLQFDFRINATPSSPYVNPLIMNPFAPIATPVPLFAGLTPGQVGLYQINVKIPSSIPAIASCTTGSPNLSAYNTVQSNLTIDIGAPASFDGAAICVQPPQ
jgi:hypothetical protein